MADATKLLRALEDYERSLQRHRAKVRGQFDQMDKRFSRLSSVYEGAAARDFKAHWQRSQRSLRDYEAGTDAVLKVLQGRIERLRRFDQSGGL